MSARPAILVSFLSGFVALGYEILWARRLSDIIGATAFASSLVIGTFFLALAAGAAVLGPHASRSASPWRLYAWLELGVLLAVLPSFFGESLGGLLASHLGAPLLSEAWGGAGSAILKTALAVAFVAPASFFMGGTLPALGQAVVRLDRLGREGNALYASNTLGGAGGIVIATFALLPSLGMTRSFLTLMTGSLALALAAFALARRAGQPAAAASASAPASNHETAPPTAEPPFVAKRKRARTKTKHATTSRHSPSAGDAALAKSLARLTPWLLLAGVSGFAVLGLEVIALHVFAQVLHNSTYTFATVLVVVITALAVGALVTQYQSMNAPRAWGRAAWMLLLASLAVLLLPHVFVGLTDGMRPFGGGASGLGVYVMRILGVGALVLGVPFALLGWVFPLVLAGAGAGAGAGGRGPGAAETGTGSAVGHHWGLLLGVNAAAALAGLALANHAAMPLLGLWGSLAAMSGVLCVAGLVVASRLPTRQRIGPWLLAATGIVAAVALRTQPLPLANLQPGDRIVDWDAGPDGVAIVVDRFDRTAPPQSPNNAAPADRRIKWNNTYSLGGTSNQAQQVRLGLLPLLLHRSPRETAYIGFATGITASAALLDPAAPAATAVELSPQITELACTHFAAWNAGFCDNPRGRVVQEDGRLFFRATRQRFDVVVADLFVPWRSGVANLYTREHFTAVRDHLRPGGVFAQWLPLFQLDARGFWGIARTFCDVFPNAWLAIADFQPRTPGVALLGWRDADGGPDWATLAARCARLRDLTDLREPILLDPQGVAMLLVGPVAAELPDDVPIMTLDRPWLADHAPRVERIRPSPIFRGAPLVDALDRIASHVPPGPFHAPVALGRQLYRFCEIHAAQGPEAATRFLRERVPGRLPDSIFLVPRPERQNWPFTRETGMLLLREARRRARP